MLTQRVYLYEVLFRFDKQGRLQGTHRKDLTVIQDGETVLSEKESPAKPVAGADIAAVLGEVCTEQCAAIDRQAAQIHALQEQIQTLQAQNRILEKQYADLEVESLK